MGLALFSVTLFLNTRLRFLENYFGGLNRVYIAHHNLGGLAFILLLFHPLFTVAKYLLISTNAAAFLLPGKDIYVTLGSVGLLSMMLLLIFTFYIKLPYHVWKITHKFLGVTFVFGILHSFLIPSDISNYPPLKIYMLLLLSMGIFSVIYRTVLGKYLIKKSEFLVESVKKLEDEIWEINLTPKEQLFKFSPGQFVFISFKSKQLSSESHPFSICSSHREQNLKLSVKNLGDFTSQIGKLEKGDLVFIEGPFGFFSSEKYPGKNQIWVAGGIGITPFLSMARSFKNEIHVDLFYQVRQENETIAIEELKNIAKNNNNFHLFTHFSAVNGRLTTENILKISGNLIGKEIFICGPVPMMKSLRDQFLQLRVKGENIHSEEFDLK